MTPKEKADELFTHYYNMIQSIGGELGQEILVTILAKQSALVAVDELLNSSPLEPNFADWDDCGGEFRYWYDAQKTHAFYFWKEVKQELQNL